MVDKSYLSCAAFLPSTCWFVVSIVAISGIAETRCLKLEARSEASSAMTGCQKVSVGVRKLWMKRRKRVLVGKVKIMKSCIVHGMTQKHLVSAP